MERITVKNTYWLDKNVYKLNDTIQADHSIPFWPKSDRHRWYWV